MNDVYSIFKIRRSRTKKYDKPALLLKRHPRFRALIRYLGPLQYEVPIWRDINKAILYATIGQMLSGAATYSIITKLLNRFKTSKAIIHWAYREKGAGSVHGVSERKRKALREWAVFAAQNCSVIRNWSNAPLEDYRRQITSVWGFGRWAADMVGIFHLGRMDIWPETDTGIYNASRLILGTTRHSEISKYIKGCETLAALYLWESLNRKVVIP